MKDDEQGWDLLLPTLLLAYWTTTGVTPFELMFGRNPCLPENISFSIPGAIEDPSQYAEIRKRWNATSQGTSPAIYGSPTATPEGEL